MQWDDKDLLNGAGTQKALFLHTSSSFSSCHSAWCFFSFTSCSSRELQGLGKQLCCRNSYINKILRVAIVTSSSSNFIKCLQKKNPGCSKFKQKAHWRRRREKLPSPPGGQKQIAKLCWHGKRVGIRLLRGNGGHANTMKYEGVGELRNSPGSWFTDLRPKARVPLFRDSVSPCSQQALTSPNNSLGCPFTMQLPA